MEKQLEIFSAGVAAGLVKQTAKLWDAQHPDCQTSVTMGGSVDLIQRALKGEPCDLLILADDTNIEQMMMPEYVDGYRVWAGNQMVLASVCEEDITGSDWRELLLAEDAVFTHMSPFGDPAGYRAVMTLMLADQVEMGLSERLLNHPGYIGMKMPPGKPDFSQAKYAIVYGSMAESRHMPYVTLPDIMNLSSDTYADVYRKAVFEVNGGVKVTGAPIRHGLTVMKASKRQEEAGAFIKKFMEHDFSAAGFISVI